MNVSDIKTTINHENKNVQEDRALKKACKDFEGILIHFMLKSMRKTLTGDSVFGTSMGKDIYQSMYDEYLSREIASGNNSIGLGETLYDQLKKDDTLRPEDQKQVQERSLDLELLNHKIR